MSTVTGTVEATSNKRPMSFYICALAFTFERFAYYSTRFLLVMFVAATVATGGLGFDKVEGGLMASNLTAYTYLAPIFGGIIADRWVGAKYCVMVGMAIMSAGYIVGYFTDSMTLLWAMIILISVGTGLFKGNLNAIIGRLFTDQKQLDSAFSTAYSFVNIGSFIGTTTVGIFYLHTFAQGDVLGFKQCFLVCGLVLLAGTIMFIIGSRTFGDVGKRPFKLDMTAEEKAREEELKAQKAEKAPMTAMEKKRIAAIVLVSGFSIIFWLFWYLAYMPVYDWWEKNANWMVGGFQVPLSWFDSLNGLCCIVLGPILGAVWFKLSQRPQGDMSMFKKTALGLALLGVAYLVFAAAEATRPANGLAPLFWIVAFGVLLSLGEMCFSPLGNSFVSKYAPSRYLSVMMGVWIVATFAAAKSYGYLYAYTSKQDFVTVQVVIAAIAIASAVVLLLLNKKLTSLVEEE